MRTHFRRERGVAPVINTVQGKAFFIKTEREDKYGRWNDVYWTGEGYYVIHRGKKHHVYKVI